MSHDEQHLAVEDRDTKAVDRSPAPTHARENRSLVAYTIAVVLVAIVARFFIAAPYLVSGPSMEETYHNHDYLIVDRLTYRFESPSRGDVIVFRLPQNPAQTLIKRVIGLPGETVIVNGTAVTIKNAQNPQGFTLNEPYIAPSDAGGPTGEIVSLGADQYFVMGDNRRVSYDSRSWGTLPGENIIGRVFIRLYPFNQISVMPGEARYQT